MAQEVRARIYHHAQRFRVTFAQDKVVEFVGTTERFDVFWLPQDGKVLVKYTDQAGSGYVSFPARPMEFARSVHAFSSNSMMPTAEEKELIWAMVRAFAQTNRPAEWDVPEKEEG